ncbi:MAG: 6-bladed beta-propeller [Balneolaceae bacterium]|nr:MAG: 6-bladed beta-propeller [Balneolaceae bacterium]
MCKFLVAIIIKFGFVSLIFGQNLGQFDNEKQSGLDLKLVETFHLSENDFLLSNITDISIGNNNSILVINDAGDRVIVYDEEGKEQTHIGGVGRGPFELLSPNLGKFTNDKIQIWDSSQLKLSIFNDDGIGIREYSGFRWAINDFMVNEEDIYVLNSGKKNAKILEKYNLYGNKVDPLIGFVEKTNEHRFFENIKPAVGMSVKADKIYFMSPSSLTLYSYDLSSDFLESVELQDPDFYVPEVNNPESIWRTPSKVEEILREASRVTGLYHIGNYTVITAQLGKDTMNPRFQQYTSENRFHRLYILNENLEHVETFRYDLFYEGKIFAGIWFAANNKLGYISRQNIMDSPNNPDEISPYVVHLFKISY